MTDGERSERRSAYYQRKRNRLERMTGEVFLWIPRRLTDGRWAWLEIAYRWPFKAIDGGLIEWRYTPKGVI
jgi:hypothetical protein